MAYRLETREDAYRRCRLFSVVASHAPWTSIFTLRDVISTVQAWAEEFIATQPNDNKASREIYSMKVPVGEKIRSTPEDMVAHQLAMSAASHGLYLKYGGKVSDLK